MKKYSTDLIRSFQRDAGNTINELLQLRSKKGWNVDELELAETAARLETAGRAMNFLKITAETAGFLRGLQAAVDKFKLPERDENSSISEEDIAFLKASLLKLQAACEVYDKKGAKSALEELDNRTWNNEIFNFLDELRTSLLHSEFMEIEEAIDEFMSEGL